MNKAENRARRDGLESRMTGPNWKLEDDYEHVTLTLPTEPPTAIVFSTETIQEMLQNVGEFRGHMKPEIPKTYALGQKVVAIPDPAWATEPDLLMGNTLLHVRDPRYGWLHYMIPREEVRKLVGYLQAQLDAPPPGQQSGRAN
jgi:hypothetical protein